MNSKLPTPRAWHFVPLPNMHSKEATACARDLVAAVTPWIEKKREARRLAAAAPIPALEQDADTLSCDVASALSRALEWDGFAVAFELRLISRWPADADLVAAIHRWSCALKKARIEAWLARKKARAA